MRRSPAHRWLSSLFALWFALVLGDPGVLHACPEHGAHASHAAATSHTSHHESGADTQQGAPEKAGGCTCVSSCCAATIAAPLQVPATFAVSTRIVAALELPDHSARVLPTPPEQLLPFAIGPPQA